MQQKLQEVLDRLGLAPWLGGLVALAALGSLAGYSVNLLLTSVEWPGTVKVVVSVIVGFVFFLVTGIRFTIFYIGPPIVPDEDE